MTKLNPVAFELIFFIDFTNNINIISLLQNYRILISTSFNPTLKRGVVQHLAIFQYIAQ
jgi:hypothetical protein